MEHARLRAIEALQALRIAQSTGSPVSIKAEPICNALQTVRDLLMVHGDEIDPMPEEMGRLAALQFLAHDLHTLILALEVTAVRAEALLKLHGADGSPKPGDDAGLEK
jgi:hypothetical protein